MKRPGALKEQVLDYIQQWLVYILFRCKIPPFSQTPFYFVSPIFIPFPYGSFIGMAMELWAQYRPAIQNV